MSIQAVAWALEQEDIPARPKLVLVSLANHANHTDGYCWLKAETIAAEAACKPRSVFRFVGDLIRNGYIRKAPRRGDDGRQRANDYWLLMSREKAEWTSIGVVEDETEDAEASADANAETQDVVQPYDTPSCDKDATLTPAADVKVSPPSCRPSDSGVSHTNTAEPSKTKPLDARARGYVPRGYRPPPPPPPQPVGSVVGHSGEMIFVFDGTPAYEAWAAVMAKRNGINRWHLTSTKVVSGESKRGWYFPSLFPPPTPDNNGSDPPHKSLATKEEIREFGKTG